jgi:hypothetical protein
VPAQRSRLPANRLGFRKPANAFYTSDFRAAGYLAGTQGCPASLDWRNLGVVTREEQAERLLYFK